MCPVCGNADMADKWKGLAIIVNAEKSEIAKKLNATKNGEYALTVK